MTDGDAEASVGADADADTDGCTLCGMPTPDPPVTDPDGEVAGVFCCQGCLVVARQVGVD